MLHPALVHRAAERRHAIAYFHRQSAGVDFVVIGELLVEVFADALVRARVVFRSAPAMSHRARTVQAGLLALHVAILRSVLRTAVALPGAAAGTPLAGGIFGLEIFLLGRLRYDALIPSFAASIFADMTTKAWQVGHTHYHIPSIPELSPMNVVCTIIAGIFFGICAILFGSLTHRVSILFKNNISFPPFRPMVGGAIVAFAVFGLGTTRYIGLGIPMILESFTTQLPPYDFVLKIVFTAITLGAAFKGGEVTPLFFIGATLGNALSYFIPLPVGLLAGMGFVAVFAGAANTPIACVFMAIELFGAECGVYAAIACIIAYFISGHRGIYGSQLIGQPKHILYGRQQGKSLNDLSFNRQNKASKKTTPTVK